jgi:hypothetical protein
MKRPFSPYKDWLVLSAMFIAEVGTLSAFIYVGLKALS